MTTEGMWRSIAPSVLANLNQEWRPGTPSVDVPNDTFLPKEPAIVSYDTYNEKFKEPARYR